MIDAIAALVVGYVFGVLCRFFYLPLPAPAHINGILAIVGLYFGYTLFWRGL